MVHRARFVIGKCPDNPDVFNRMHKLEIFRNKNYTAVKFINVDYVHQQE